MLSKKRIVAMIALAIVLLAAGVAGGVVLDRQVLSVYIPPAGIAPSAEPSFRLMSEAWNAIERVYVDRSAVQPQKLAYGAIDGMVQALGDTGHSRFLTPEMLRAQQDYNQGQFEGIGAYVEMKDGYATIVAPFDDSPAQRAGLLPGDVFLAVDGVDVTGMPLNEVVQRVLGPAGTSVTLTILTPSTGVSRDVTIVRARIDLQNVTWSPVPGTTIAHVRLSAFSQGVSQDLAGVLQEIEDQGLTGVVLDLRNNPGGLLNEAIDTTSQFLPAGQLVLLRQDGQGRVVEEKAHAGGAGLALPLVVLVNEGSASASEIVSGALQDAGRARLVGEKTFGTGTVLNEYDLSDGSALLLATEQWLTPKGRVIWHQGITPDVIVTLEPDARLLLPAAEHGLSAAEWQASADQQLQQAVQEVQKAAVVSGGSGNGQ